MKELIHAEITGQIIGAAFEVYNLLGYGFLEKVYENALIRELQLRGLHATDQYPIKVIYKDVEVGDYSADILVEDKVIVELKTGEAFNPVHEAQLLNYLKATGIKVGLLINFGPQKCEHKRLVY
jgi:GxxExxY protein